MAEFTLEGPIPTKLILGDLLTEPDPYYSAPHLDQVIDFCWLHGVGLLRDLVKWQQAEHFRRFTQRIHCEENLEFLVAIYMYEYYYCRLVPDKNDSMSSASVNHGFLATIDDDDIDFARGPGETSQIHNEIDAEDYKFLSSMWTLIIATFINEELPKQVNLDGQGYDDILQHPDLGLPSVLVSARNQVWQILMETVWPEYSKLTLPVSPHMHLHTVTLLVLLARTITPKARKLSSPDLLLLSILLLLSHLKMTSLMPLLKVGLRLTSPLEGDHSGLKFWKRKH